MEDDLTMNALATSGVIVITLPGIDAYKHVRTILVECPEVKHPVAAYNALQTPIRSTTVPAQFALGGFGAAGLPSLFHHPLIREIRLEVYNRIAPLLATIHPGRNLEMLFDRFSIRRVGTSLSAETWHRDVSPYAKNGDIIYGGWLNLDPPDSPNQGFSGIPKNILKPDTDEKKATGFAKFAKNDMPQLEKDLHAAGGRIKVPPQSIILFNQTIAHKVTPDKATRTSYRLYFGWRITDSNETLFHKKYEEDNNNKKTKTKTKITKQTKDEEETEPQQWVNTQQVIDKQLVPLLPSGQIPPMYAMLHWVNWLRQLEAFSNTLKPECFEYDITRFTRTDKDKVVENMEGRIVAKYMHGLKQLKMAFDDYTQAHKTIFEQHRLLNNTNIHDAIQNTNAIILEPNKPNNNAMPQPKKRNAVTQKNTNTKQTQGTKRKRKSSASSSNNASTRASSNSGKSSHTSTRASSKSGKSSRSKRGVIDLTSSTHASYNSRKKSNTNANSKRGVIDVIDLTSSTHASSNSRKKSNTSTIASS